jgi:hypothetical protein
VSNETEADNGFDRFVDNVAFGPGEKLSFDIGYGFINAGHATLEVAELIEYDGRPCYQVISTARSNKFFSSFYRVEDRVESIIDAIGIFPWYFEKNLSEGSYRSDRSYAFNQAEHVVYYKDKVGSSIFIDNFTDGKNYPLEVKILRRETIKVKAGKFDCLVLEPLMRSAGVFRHEGKLTVWLTDDRLKMPVLMKSKVLVGSISAELSSYELGEIAEF